MSNKSRLIKRFMPYASERDGIIFHHVHHTVDGEVRGDLASGSNLSSTRWIELTLTIGLELRSGVLDRVLHAEERRAPPVALVLAVRNPTSYLARSFCFVHSDSSTEKYEHTLSLPRSELRGEVSITPYLVRTTNGTRKSGHAWRKGAWLATSDPLIFYVDEQKPRVGNDLEILRKRFADVPEIPVTDHGNWFYLQLDGDPPRLYLNDAHAAMMAVLYDKSTRGKRAATRDVLFDLLDATVWPALVLHAARARQEDGETPYAWQDNILRLWVRWLHPDEHDLEAGVERLTRRAADAPAAFLLELNAALQRREHVRRIDRLLVEVTS